MTVKEFLKRYKSFCRGQLGPLKYQEEQLGGGIPRAGQGSNNENILKSLLVFGVILLVGVGMFSLGGAMFGLITDQLAALLIGVISAVGATSLVVAPIVEKMLEKQRTNAYNDRRTFLSELRGVRKRITELEKIVEEIEKTEEFCEKLNQGDVLNYNTSLTDTTFSSYLEKGMSVLSILYLEKRKMLPLIFDFSFGSGLHLNLSSEEEKKIIDLGKKLDEQFKDNPQYFLMDENGQINDQVKKTDNLEKNDQENKMMETSIPVKRSRLARNHATENANQVVEDRGRSRR